MAKLDILPNECPAGDARCWWTPTSGFAVARFLRDDPQLELDYCSNVTGIDWPPATTKTKVKKKVAG